MIVLLISYPIHADNLLEEKFKNRLEKMNLEYIDEYYCDDFNSDDKDELIARVKKKGADDSFGEVWVVTLDEDEELKKIFEWKVRSESRLKVNDDYYSAAYNKEFYLNKSNFGTDYYDSSNLIFTFENGQIRFARITESQNEVINDSLIYKTSIDFIHHTKYYYHQGYDYNNDAISSFYHFFIPCLANEIEIDGRLEPEWDKVYWVNIDGMNKDFIIYGQDNWSDKNDLSYRAKTLLDKNNLYLYIEVRDDKVIFNEGTDLKQDHLEIWLEDNINDSDDQIPGDGLNQFGIYESHAVKYTPDTEEVSDIEHVIRPIEGGYVIEARLKLANYLIDPVFNYDSIRLSLVISDTDNQEKVALDTLLASSDLEWGNSASLGAMYLDFGDTSKESLHWAIEKVYDGIWNINK